VGEFIISFIEFIKLDLEFFCLGISFVILEGSRDEIDLMMHRLCELWISILVIF
jgi:hypothetical protein